jgi:hypothetical protein
VVHEVEIVAGTTGHPIGPVLAIEEIGGADLFLACLKQSLASTK